MHCTTNKEVSDWLSNHSLPEDPYRQGSQAEHYLQFHSPSTHCKLDAFARRYYANIIPHGESLIHMSDWSPYELSQIITMEGIRAAQSERRNLIDAPGHHLSPAESEIGVALFSLSTSFEWSSYIYCPKHRSTLYNWEGEIFDFWTDSDSALQELKMMLEDFELSETKHS